MIVATEMNAETVKIAAVSAVMVSAVIESAVMMNTEAHPESLMRVKQHNHYTLYMSGLRCSLLKLIWQLCTTFRLQMVGYTLINEDHYTVANILTHFQT